MVKCCRGMSGMSVDTCRDCRDCQGLVACRAQPQASAVPVGLSNRGSTLSLARGWSLDAASTHFKSPHHPQHNLKRSTNRNILDNTPWIDHALFARRGTGLTPNPDRNFAYSHSFTQAL